MGIIEERVARSTQFCPSCESVAVKHVTTTTIVVYLRCEACAHIWSIPERRTIPRSEVKAGGGPLLQSEFSGL